MTLQLKNLEPFARGGNRLCFVHPDDPNRCIKVRRPDFTLADCRRKKGFPKNLRPLSAFDDNLEEYRVIAGLQSQLGSLVFEHIYHCYGFVETDLGTGLETELIKDGDGMVSFSLKQYIWEEGFNESCKQAVSELKDFWWRHMIPSRDLLTHNIVVQRDHNGFIIRLVVIDGLGSPFLVPFSWIPSFFRRKYIATRLKRLDQRIVEFVNNCDTGKYPSPVGMLLQRNVSGLKSRKSV